MLARATSLFDGNCEHRLLLVELFMHLDRFFALKESGTDDGDLRSALDASKYKVENVDV